MEIVTFSDPPFNSKFSGNTIDICPVGALTSADFRFKARVWELVDTPSVCGHCPVGCNIILGARVGEIRRSVPRQNEAVNEVWICDKGRFAHHYLRSPQRIPTPLIRRDGQLVQTTWEEALKFASSELARIQKQFGPQALAGIGSLRTTNEEQYLFQKFMRVVLGTNNLDHRLEGGWGEAERWALPTASIRALEEADAILMVGCDPSEEVPVLELRIKKAMRRHAAKLIVLSPRPLELSARATHWLQHRPGSEGAVLAGILKRLLESSSLDEKSRRSIEDSLPTTATDLGLSEDELDGAAATLAQTQRVALL
ncbi:MAG: molybdopterin-dependent oxidoreductase, partial [Chloroflexi bacterium]|nr:molybdopterin-dependent oxidoreductase [Chloroflexota bacterium]